MSNKYYNSDTAPSKQSSARGGSNKAQGSPVPTAMPQRTASWPGLPGKSGPDRSGGAPKHGKLGEFIVYQQFSPPKLGTGARFANLTAKLATNPKIDNPAAVAASIGREKYGATRFAKLGAAGKK